MSIKATLKDRKGFEKVVELQSYGDYPTRYFKIAVMSKMDCLWASRADVVPEELFAQRVDHITFELRDFHRNSAGEIVEAFYEEV